MVQILDILTVVFAVEVFGAASIFHKVNHTTMEIRYRMLESPDFLKTQKCKNLVWEFVGVRCEVKILSREGEDLCGRKEHDPKRYYVVRRDCFLLKANLRLTRFDQVIFR